MLEKLRKALSNAIDELSYEERVILSLYYCEELTMNEIGEVLGIAQSKARQIYSNALLNLRGKFHLLC
jgi:RNA polymerase sigma factor for flagellar operon FliA